MNQEKPSETVSSQYTEGGEEYLEYQLTSVETANRIALPRFEPYVKPTDTVIDFGCGTGWLLKLLPGAEKLGVEPNPAAREVAAANGIKTVGSTDEVADNFADVIVSNHALEHSLSPYDELRAIHRMLKPDGQFVIGLPIDDWRAHRKVDPEDPNHHLFTWTPLLLSNLLGEAGFEVVSIRAFTYLQPYYNEWLFPRLPRRVFDAIAYVFGRFMRYHQLYAVAKPKSAT